MSGGIEIPLFPLNAVLFPGGSLPLRIFEARYIDLVRNCMRSGDGFGIVLIVEGPEAGAQSATAHHQTPLHLRVMWRHGPMQSLPVARPASVRDPAHLLIQARSFRFSLWPVGHELARSE